MLNLEILIKNNAENQQKTRDSMEKLPARKKAAWDSNPTILHILDVWSCDQPILAVCLTDNSNIG